MYIDAEQFGYLTFVLLSFETISNLKINLGKPKIVPIEKFQRQKLCLTFLVARYLLFCLLISKVARYLH